ncbi:uncharacterized protein LOC141913137 [Tubulanus polymorphus]|uniref:uncharacterized protein LOC141913137 n=1 Tax=Tubulanus polymorphus TaxID=672921 RepID=UPI003DA60866
MLVLRFLTLIVAISSIETAISRKQAKSDLSKCMRKGNDRCIEICGKILKIEENAIRDCVKNGTVNSTAVAETVCDSFGRVCFSECRYRYCGVYDGKMGPFDVDNGDVKWMNEPLNEIVKINDVMPAKTKRRNIKTRFDRHARRFK